MRSTATGKVRETARHKKVLGLGHYPQIFLPEEKCK